MAAVLALSGTIAQPPLTVFVLRCLSGPSEATSLTASGLIGALLYFAQAVFIPIALAVLFALLMSAPVEPCTADPSRAASVRSSICLSS